MKTIDLPEIFNIEELEFIENWYSEDGMQQLLASNGKPFIVLEEKPPAENTLYVAVDNIPVPYIHRDPKTLRRVLMSELKTVKLLLMSHWIGE